MKKKIILLFSLILLTGCSAEYNLTIVNDSYKEELNVDNVKIDNINDLVLPLNYDVDEYDIDKVKPGDVGFYNAKLDNNGYLLSHTFNYSSFIKSTLLNSCYDRVDVVKNSKNIYISTVGSFRCYDNYNVDDIKVNIISKYKLVDSNADSVNNNVYSWNINKDNLDKGIYIEFVLPKKSEKKKKIFINNDNNFYLFLFQASLILFLLVIIMVIKKKNDEDEKM
ncbi:MAG: hypothetical protein IKP77_05105 [Acholeplasmatales bacterium]|nr:hypothetical protein [Acholeplasmatales bacterium]